jgi:hypothetical protein
MRTVQVRWVAYGALGGATVVLALLTLGFPGTLVLVGAWLLAAAIGRTVPGLSGTVSWAASILVLTILLTVLSAALALASPRPHGSLVYLLILAVPAVLGLVGWLVAGTRDGIHQAPRPPQRGALAIAVVIAGLTLAKWIASIGKDFGVAWAMSGDARNHILITRSVLHDGGLTAQELRKYPALVNNIIALIAGATGRNGLPVGQLMLHDAQALASIYVLAGIAVAAMFMAALLELLPGDVALAPRLPPSVVLVLLVCAATCASPLVLGTALFGGFVTAYATLAMAVACVVLALRFCSEPSPVSFALLGSVTPFMLFAWSPLAMVPAALVVLVAFVGLQRRRRDSDDPTRGAPGWAWVAAAIVSFGAVLATLGIVVVEWSLLVAQFSVSGAIWPPQTRYLYLLGFVAAGVILGTRNRLRRRQLLVPLTVAVAGGIMVAWLMSLPASGVTPYYGIKSLWLLASCLVWVGFVPALLAVADMPRAVGGATWPEVARVGQAAAWSGVTLIVLGFSTTLVDPLPAARAGWSQPSASVVAETVAAADSYHRFVFWQWSDSGDDRLGNFWSALAWDSGPSGNTIAYAPDLPDGLSSWAYHESGAISQLCSVARAVPHIAIITTSPNLSTELDAACPHTGARVAESSPSS